MMTVLEQDAYKALIRMDRSLSSIAESLTTLVQHYQQIPTEFLVSESPLSRRAKNIIRHNFKQVKTVEDLANLTASEILMSRGAGQQVIQDINNCLSRYKLSLRTNEKNQEKI